MNEINTEKLINAFPNLYPKDFCFDCGDGWFGLIWNLSTKLDKEIVEIKPFVTPEELPCILVKQKYGYLRYYTMRLNEKMKAAIQETEEKSATICEFCGEPGKRQDGGCLVVLCAKCAEKKNSLNEP